MSYQNEFFFHLEKACSFLKADIRKEFETSINKILEEKLKSTETTSQDHLLTIEEVGKLLGLSKSTVTTLKKEGLPHYKIKDSIRFNRSEVLEYMKQYKAGHIEERPIVSTNKKMKANGYSLKNLLFEEKLTSLFQKLKEHGFVDTSAPNCRKIFTMTFNVGDEKINWLGTNSELAYFMLLLWERYKIVNTGKAHMKYLCHYFLINGNSLNPNTNRRSIYNQVKHGIQVVERSVLLDKIFQTIFGYPPKLST